MHNALRTLVLFEPLTLSIVYCSYRTILVHLLWNKHSFIHPLTSPRWLKLPSQLKLEGRYVLITNQALIFEDYHVRDTPL
jgi:hypothetical protein